jgi:hypothetical protein
MHLGGRLLGIASLEEPEVLHRLLARGRLLRRAVLDLALVVELDVQRCPRRLVDLMARPTPAVLLPLLLTANFADTTPTAAIPAVFLTSCAPV